MKVLVTSTLTDVLNTNSRIRVYLGEAFTEILGRDQVAVHPLELAERGIQAFRPDLVVAVGSVTPDNSSLRGLRRAADRVSAQLAFWLHDDPYEIDYAFKAELNADIIFSNDSWAVHHYRHARVHHLPLAASVQHHYRPLKPLDERGYEVFFCGVAYPNRVEFLRRADRLLSTRAVAILGSDWPSDIRCALNRRLSVSEMADYAQDACLTLNLGRDLSIANARYQLPQATPGPRTFEIALSGSAQLFFISGLEIEDYFQLGREIIPIDGIADLARAIEQMADEPDEIYRIGERAQIRALNEHTYVHRARQMLAVCSSSSARQSAFA